MSPSPPFPSPLLPHTHSPSGRPRIIGEHRPPTILQHQSGTEPSNGDYLLYLLQAGNQVSQQHSPPYQPHGAGIGGIAGGRQDYHRQLASQYNLAMPGILPGGGENLMAAWDPAVAALGPSHSYNHNGVVARLVVDDERDFLSGSYPASPFQGRTMGSGWPTYNPTLPYPFPSPSLLPASCVSLSSPSDHRQFLGRTMISNPSGMPESLYGHVDMLQQRSVEGNSTNYQQPQLRVVQPETQSAPTLPLDARCRAGLTERSTHQQFFGNGAELMKLLQISTSKCSAEGPEPKALDKVTAGGGSGSSASGPKVSPAIAHGPIGPPKRSDGNARPTSADDLLGRFWPAPTAAVGNGSQQGHVHKPPAFGVVENSSNLTFKDQGKWGEQRSSGAEMWDRSVGGSESVSVSTFGSTDGGNLRFVPQSMWFPSAKPIGGAGLPDSLEFCNGRGLLGGWLGDLEGMGMTGGGGQQFRKGGVEARNKIAEQQSCSGLISLPDEQQQQRADGSMTKDMDEDYHPRDINGRIEAARVAAGGGTRRGPGIRGDCGSRRSGKSVVGHWVAVTDRQKDREVLEASIPSDGGTESCLEKSCTSAANSIKEESIALANEASGSQRGNREEQKRRKGQQQEWRMKIPSSQAQVLTQTQSSAPKVSGFATDSESSDVGNGNLRASSIFKTRPLASQVDHPGLPSNLVQDAAATPGSAVEESKKTYDCRSSHHTNGGNDSRECAVEKEDDDDIPDTYDERDISLVHTPAQEESEFGERQEHTREFPRLAHRAPGVPSLKPEMRYRLDLEKFCSQLLDIYVSLIPTVEEIRTRRQFLSHLDHLVSREWPGAMLFLFGSCANAFGVRNSDIDVCLSISDEQLSKADLVLKMAAILRSDNMQNVVALTHARVPIVKFTDASTGISCDICVNNKLAVVNSKLLHDYSLIDERLRQLAFLVKHWAKRRQVNETYRGTLSSYAYVLMCIHFLQQRKPPILPCLQEMQPTYRVTVCDIDCSYYDRVETLQSFGISNKESLGELLTSFFEYWAFRHDYNKAVISVRTGGYLSKDEKEWTRRVGNERHLICIEDPLEVEHDLGRVVDRHSIRVLRDEFHRAAKVLRHDLNPCVALFEPYMRDKP